MVPLYALCHRPKSEHFGLTKGTLQQDLEALSNCRTFGSKLTILVSVKATLLASSNLPRLTTVSFQSEACARVPSPQNV